MSVGLVRPGVAAWPWHPSGSPALNEFLLAWAEDELRGELGRSVRLDGRAFEIFAQGSRVNGTHLDQGSDIDLVLMLTAPFADYGWEQFRDDVLAAMGESYTVRMGRRCLTVDDPGSLFGEMVDVLVATEHRWGDERGVFFRDENGVAIVNYPRRHRLNGDVKDRATGGRFKETVRAAKRARRVAVAELMIDGVLASPYLLECLLFNVPDRIYSSAGSPREALGWLRGLHRDDPGSFAALPSQNGINRLFGPGPDQWEPAAAARIIDVLHQL